MVWLKRSGLLLIATLVIAAAFCSMKPAAAEAYLPPIKVFINWQQVNFPDVQPYISNGRTLVPLRFCAESPSFGAVVSYDPHTGLITVKRGEITAALWPYSHNAYVNGQYHYLDVVPVLNYGRTMVPLRFISEIFGFPVGWDNDHRWVLITIPTNGKEVLGYYYGGSYSEFKAQAANLTDVAVHWYETDGSGNLISNTPSGYRDALDYASQQHVNTQASIALFDKELLHSLLTSPEARSCLITGAVQLAQQEGYHDINIDLEGVAPEDKEVYLSFLSDISQALKQAGVGLIVAVPAEDKNESWNAAYDYTRIATYANKLVLMAYDYHWRGGTPGAIAPLDWVTRSLAYVRQFVPANQILLGLGIYGFDWPDGQAATSLFYDDAIALAAAHQAPIQWDSTGQLPHFNYTDQNGVPHQVWFESDASLQFKLNLARDQGLAGVSIWRLGMGFPTFWSEIAAYK